MNKRELIEAIIRDYQHDYAAEGSSISKRRAWYLLKPKFAQIPSYIQDGVEYIEGLFHKGKPVQAVNNADFNKIFNKLAEDGEIDDTFIDDNSRITIVGEHLPHIIIVAEKKTIESTVRALSEKLGVSAYIAGGFSSIYAAKGLAESISELTNDDIVLITMTDYDIHGFNIDSTVAEHFKNADSYRVLLDPEQIPEDKVGEWFDESAELGKHYELDVLNIHQLAETFSEALPRHIANEIRDYHMELIADEKKQLEIDTAIYYDDEVTVLRDKLLALQDTKRELYEARFLEVSPVTVYPFSVHELYQGEVEIEIEDWV